MQDYDNENNNNGDGSMVILHVYELQPDKSGVRPEDISRTDRALLLVSGLLPTIGMGAYHTSIEVMDLKYTFAGNAGVMCGRANGPDVGVPKGAKGPIQQIPLGKCLRSKQELIDIIKRLSTLFYTRTSYNIMHRNCNHFTETLATCLVVNDPKCPLQTFPRWLNRLANTGALVMKKDQNVVECNILDEARIACGY
eukprot:scaffold8136_cov127-Cylindrotheca_fusiformis.AAC.12